MLKDKVAEAREFFEVMNGRRTIRQFTSRPIPKEILVSAIRAAATGPSGANRQPWFFALITDSLHKAKIREASEMVENQFYARKATEEWLADLRPIGTTPSKPFLTEAPALIGVFSRTEFDGESGEKKRTYYPIESTGIAVGILLTALHHAGVATLTYTPRPMRFLNELLRLDESFRPFMIIVAGYPKLPLQLPDLKRKSLGEVMREY